MARLETRRIALALGAVVGVAALLALAVFVSGRPPEGPVAVDWDATRCSRCGMLVSDPGFAGQLHLEDGSVRIYDDPGCLLLDLDELPPSRVHAVWLHHREQDRWLPLADSAFVHVAHSPMGYGLAVVALGESPASLDVDGARALLAEPRAGGGTTAAEQQP
jgi:hypothetical protein